MATVAIAHIVHRQTPGEFAADYGVSLAQVYAALACYYERKDEIDALILERERIANELREQRPGSRHPPLFG